jgi:hypothetical protein
MNSQTVEILDVCLEKMEQGIPVDEVLMEYPQCREELKDLLTIAKDIESIPLPQVREEAVASCLIKVRNALQLQKKTVWKAKLPRLQWPRLIYFPSPSWVKALVFILITLLVSWGSVNLSSGSIPGNLLYPFKLTTERVKFFLTIDPEGKAELRLTYSEERMQELVRYLDKKGELNINLLKAMLDEAALVTDNISRLPRNQAIACCLKLEELCAFHINVLEGLKSKVPAQQRQELENAIRICQQRMEWMDKVIRNEVPIGEWGPFALKEI